MKLSDRGKLILMRLEGVSYRSYLDSAGLRTIGVGHLIQPGEKFNEPISKEEALELLEKDLVRFEEAVNKVKTKNMTQNQFDALVMLAFNIGVSAFLNSTVVKRITTTPKEKVAEAFLMWKKAGGKVIPGLIVRRMIEATIYLGGKMTDKMKEVYNNTLRPDRQERVDSEVRRYFE